MTNDEKLDAILARVTAIEARLDMGLTIVQPSPPTPLDAFVRPPAGAQPHGLGVQMREVDVAEAILRACHGVNWRGDLIVAGKQADEVWSIVERLKVADPAILPYYQMLDPLLCGLGLLSGFIPPHPEDSYPFSPTRSVREAFAGQTVESFLADQMAVISGGGGASGA
jgi:hypothetical protein